MTDNRPPKPEILTAADPTVTRIIPELAVEIGLNESIALLQIGHWIKIADHFKDGDWWTFQSVRKMKAKAFPYWSVSTINRTTKSLFDKKLIKVGNYNEREGDNTQWFALNIVELRKLKSIVIRGGVFQNETGVFQNETTLPEITPESKEKDLPPDGGSGGQKLEDEKPETTPSEQSLVSEANAVQPPSSEAPPKTEDVLPDTTGFKAMFSAVCLHVFGITFDMQPDEEERSRIGQIASWLSGNETRTMKDRGVAKLKTAAQPEHVKRFTDWYHSKYQKADTPRDIVKFSEHWRAFGSEMATKAAAARRAEEERRKKADDLPPPETEAERLARVEEMRRQKEVVRQQSKATEKVRTDNLWTR